jgi:DNA-binding NarL/FixJ family response regulator
MNFDRKRNARTIHVLVADSSHLHTQLLVGVLNSDPDFNVVSSDLNLTDVMSASMTQKVGVFVLSAFADEDARSGLKILQELRETYPKARAVILLDSSEPKRVQEALRAGAKGVFDHRESPEMLCRCVRELHGGRVWVNNDHVALALESLASAPKVRAVGGNGIDLLSKRESEVVSCLAEGLSNREIAERLGLSQHTIKNHLFRIFDKLGVSNRIELLFMTLSQNTSAPALMQDLLKDPTGDYDQRSLDFCEKAAEHGVLAAQLMLARHSWMGRAGGRDPKRAYLWFSVALDQLTRTRNSVMKTMNPLQLDDAERQVRERLSKGKSADPYLVARHHSNHQESVVA